MNYVYLGSNPEIDKQLRTAASGEDVVCMGQRHETLSGTESMVGAFLSNGLSHGTDSFLVNEALLRNDTPSPFQAILRARSLRSVAGRLEFPQPEVDQLLNEFDEVKRSGIKHYKALQIYLAGAFSALSLTKEEFMKLRKAYPISRKRIFAVNGLHFSRHVKDRFLWFPTGLGFRAHCKEQEFRKSHPEGIRHRRRMAFYRAVIRPIIAYRLKFKKHKRVAFVLADLGVWKTETLYKAMLADSRFEPQLAVVEAPGCNVDEVVDYLKRKGYDFTIVPAEKTICQALHPDVIFYQKPYYEVVTENHEFYNNIGALFCYAGYGMRSCTNNWITNSPLLGNCWQIYYENERNRQLYSGLNPLCRNNGRATGLPVMDEMNVSRDLLSDPWKSSEGKKRIIYAPHFSIDPKGWTNSSTFLTLGPLMLELAEKYSDRVQWAFKPHPLLKSRLNEIWGEQRTDEYYRRWADASWSQYENGRYAGLFAHSDALIHDCFSFTIEYLATGNPAMYLKDPEVSIMDNLNDTYLQAMLQHVQGNTRNAIEIFIEDVINNSSANDAGRRAFIAEFLTPPPPGAVASILEALA